MRAEGRKRPELDRLRLELPVGQRHGQRGRPATASRATRRPSQRGPYSGMARFYEVTKGKATGASSAFIGWIERSAAAKKIITRSGCRSAERAAVLERLRNPWPDHRAERTLGAVSLLVCALVVAMVVFVGIHAWPIFEHNGLSWLGSGGDLGSQLADMQNTTQHPPPSAYHLRAWPLVYGTLLDDGRRGRARAGDRRSSRRSSSSSSRRRGCGGSRSR